jgi:hypothetical protein
MRKRNVVAAVFAVTCITATGAIAAQPDNPGCFGRDRAAYATVNGSAGAQAPGVGYYASTRAGDNGAINQDYKDACGG